MPDDPKRRTPRTRRVVRRKPVTREVEPAAETPGTFSTRGIRLGTGPRIAVNPGVIDAIAKARPEAPPLLLVPLRLEYRVVDRKVPVVEEPPPPKKAKPDPRRPFRGIGSVTGGVELRKHRAEISEIRRKPLSVGRPKLRVQREIWFRWYPDEGFSERGIQPVSADEVEALEHFDRAMTARPWHDASDPAVAAAWQTLAHTVGAERAIHLLRTRGTEAAAGTAEARTGRIAALPRRVALFGVGNDGKVTPLGEGTEIPDGTEEAPSPVSYTPDAIEPGEWLHGFGAALEMGMGMKITDPGKIRSALAADWVVAVGIRGRGDAAEVESLVRDAVANGNFSFVPQDSPTNAAPGTRTLFAGPRGDLLGFLEAATQRESGAFTAGGGHAADLLAEALGIDAATLRGAVYAADGAFEDARAMLRVVGPALLDAVVDGVTVLEGVDENTFIDVLAAAVTARGPLPTVRFGRNPYGVLPVTRIGELRVEGTDAKAKVHGLLRQYSLVARYFQAARADEAVPVLEPDDPQAAEKLEEILELNPVSRRLDVGEAGAAEVQALGCPYVSSPARPAAGYLDDLRSKPIQELPDPSEADRSWPLLYRLARLSLVANTALRVINEKSPQKRTLRDLDRLSPTARRKLPGGTVFGESLAGLAGRKRPTTKIPPATLRSVRVAARDFADALLRLREVAQRPEGTAQLETLLLEVLDLFQHRVDAWATGLAYARLTERRRAGGTGLVAGYYGILSGLRPESATGSGDGYIQAPSLPQATTAAVLRSAYRRHRDNGAFETDLPSRRVRRALAILDMQKKGLSLQEILGLRGERWLHDQKADLLIPELRFHFPLRNPLPPESDEGSRDVSPEPVQVRLFDGMALLEGSLDVLPEAMRDTAKRLKTVLADDLDALSDLVMCEAVHQRALGQGEAANAWLQVLSGEPVPGDPAFLRTQRHGQGASHRVSLLLPPAAAPPGGAPREIAEPALAALAGRLLDGFGAAEVPVTLSVARGEGRAEHTLHVSPAVDLGMKPIDLVVGGESELRVRLRNHLASRWLAEAGMVEALGTLPATGVAAFLNGEVAFTADLEGGPVRVAGLIQAAGRLRALVQRGRHLEPADLAAAASPDRPLTEAAEVALLTGTVAELQARAQALRAKLAGELNQLDAARLLFVDRARETRRRVDAGRPEAEVVQALVETEQARRALVPLLQAASRYAEPEGLAPFTSEEAVAEPEVTDETLTRLAERLARRRDGLADAVTRTTPNTPQTRSEARAALRLLVQALQGALDGESMPVLPPFARTPETTPLVEPDRPMEDALGAWAAVREGVALALAGVAGLPGFRAFPVAEAATDDDPVNPDDPEDRDDRGPEEAPRSRHFGIFLADGDPAGSAGSFAGIVPDEWVEQRPSRTQMAALAVNYDSPQSEPPHCLLLCVPPNPELKVWTEEEGAEMVWEVIQWMKARALSTEDKLTPAALFPSANQVAYQAVGRTRKRRIPTRRYEILEALLGKEGFVRATGPAARIVGAEGIGIHETGGWSRTRE